VDQQNIQAQQQNKKGVFIDSETLQEVENSASSITLLAFLVFISAIIGAIIANDITVQISFFIIMMLSVFIMGIAISSSITLDRVKPKVKKIIKTVIYENGQVEEKEIKYDC